jgi:hypothetical protein
VSDDVRQNVHRPDGRPDQEIDGRLDLLQRSYASVNEAHNNLEDRVGRLLNGVAFLTAAILALVALGSGNYATRLYSLPPFKVPLALAVVVVFLVTVAFAVILLLSAMSGPLGLPIIAGGDMKARFSSQGTPKNLPEYIYESSHLDYEGIADLDLEEWRQKWSGADPDRPQYKPQSLYDMKKRREASLIGDVHNVAVKTSFKRDRNTEAVSMLLYSLLAFAASVFVIILAAYKSHSDPITLRFWARLALGVIFGAYFWLELALPGRLEQQSITLDSEDADTESRSPQTTRAAGSSGGTYRPPGAATRRSRVGFSIAVFLLVVSMLTFQSGWPWWATTMAFTFEGILVTGGLWAFSVMQTAMSRDGRASIWSRAPDRGTQHELEIQRALLALVLIAAVGGIVSEIEGWYFGQFMAVWIASLVLLVAALLRPTFALWAKREDRNRRGPQPQAPADATVVAGPADEHGAVKDVKPGLDDIEKRFIAVLEGRMSRRDAGRWAKHWLFDENLTWEELEKWGLNRLSDTDIRRAPAGAYLYDQKQVRAWLWDLRDRRMK